MPEIVLNKDTLKKFIATDSFSGNIILFFCYRAYKEQIPFKISEASEKIGTTEDYFLSHVVVLTALSLLKYNEKNDIYIITDFNDILGELIGEGEINKLTIEHDNKEKNNKLLWSKYLEKIDKYFE